MNESWDRAIKKQGQTSHFSNRQPLDITKSTNGQKLLLRKKIVSEYLNWFHSRMDVLKRKQTSHYINITLICSWKFSLYNERDPGWRMSKNACWMAIGREVYTKPSGDTGNVIWVVKILRWTYIIQTVSKYTIVSFMLRKRYNLYLLYTHDIMHFSPFIMWGPKDVCSFFERWNIKFAFKLSKSLRNCLKVSHLRVTLRSWRECDRSRLPAFDSIICLHIQIYRYT